MWMGRTSRKKGRGKWERKIDRKGVNNEGRGNGKKTERKNGGKSRVKMLNLVNICKSPFHTLHIFAQIKGFETSLHALGVSIILFLSEREQTWHTPSDRCQ